METQRQISNLRQFSLTAENVSVAHESETKRPGSASGSLAILHYTPPTEFVNLIQGVNPTAMSALHQEMLLISIKVTLQCGKDSTALSYVTLKR